MTSFTIFIEASIKAAILVFRLVAYLRAFFVPPTCTVVPSAALSTATIDKPTPTLPVPAAKTIYLDTLAVCLLGATFVAFIATLYALARRYHTGRHIYIDKTYVAGAVKDISIVSGSMFAQFSVSFYEASALRESSIDPFDALVERVVSKADNVIDRLGYPSGQQKENSTVSLFAESVLFDCDGEEPESSTVGISVAPAQIDCDSEESESSTVSISVAPAQIDCDSEESESSTVSISVAPAQIDCDGERAESSTVSISVAPAQIDCDSKPTVVARRAMTAEITAIERITAAAKTSITAEMASLERVTAAADRAIAAEKDADKRTAAAADRAVAAEKDADKRVAAAADRAVAAEKDADKRVAAAADRAIAAEKNATQIESDVSASTATAAAASRNRIQRLNKRLDAAKMLRKEHEARRNASNN